MAMKKATAKNLVAKKVTKKVAKKVTKKIAAKQPVKAAKASNGKTKKTSKKRPMVPTVDRIKVDLKKKKVVATRPSKAKMASIKRAVIKKVGKKKGK